MPLVYIWSKKEYVNEESTKTSRRVTYLRPSLARVKARTRKVADLGRPARPHRRTNKEGHLRGEETDARSLGTSARGLSNGLVSGADARARNS